MKKLALIFWILGSFISICFAEMSEVEWQQNKDMCFKNKPIACQALIDNGLVSVEQCNKDSCIFVGTVYDLAGHSKEAILYYKKAIDLGDNKGYILIGDTYRVLQQDYLNAKKYYEAGCNKINNLQSKSCFFLGVMYYNGDGVKQDYNKAIELYKKACNMEYDAGCYNLGISYLKGQGVNQNILFAKAYFWKSCDLGLQKGCNLYKQLNELGVR